MTCTKRLIWQWPSQYTFVAWLVTGCWLWWPPVEPGWAQPPVAAGQATAPFTVAVLPPELLDDAGDLTPDALLSTLERALARAGLDVLPRAQVLSAVPPAMPLDFNPTCAAAQALGARVGSEGYVLVRLRRGERSLPDRQTAVGGTLHLFAVDTRTGQLVDSTHLDFIEAGQPFLPTMGGAIAAAAERFAQSWREQQASPAVADCGVDEEEVLDLRAGAASPDAQPPTPLERLQPEPTESARAAGVTATVLVEVCVDRQGQVRAVNVLRWAGYGLEAAVEKALQATRFRPARRQGKPIAARFIAAFNFRSRLHRD
ncbi:MAG: energy transducer TonB [Acidobacteriota bacterium]